MRVERFLHNIENPFQKPKIESHRILAMHKGEGEEELSSINNSALKNREDGEQLFCQKFDLTLE